MFVLGFVNTCGATLAVNYLVDCFKEMSGDALSSVIFIRNTMSFAIGYGITPWLKNLGTQNCFISAAFIRTSSEPDVSGNDQMGQGVSRVKERTILEIGEKKYGDGCCTLRTTTKSSHLCPQNSFVRSATIQQEYTVPDQRQGCNQNMAGCSLQGK